MHLSLCYSQTGIACSRRPTGPHGVRYWRGHPVSFQRRVPPRQTRNPSAPTWLSLPEHARRAASNRPERVLHACRARVAAEPPRERETGCPLIQLYIQVLPWLKCYSFQPSSVTAPPASRSAQSHRAPLAAFGDFQHPCLPSLWAASPATFQRSRRIYRQA